MPKSVDRRHLLVLTALGVGAVNLPRQPGSDIDVSADTLALHRINLASLAAAYERTPLAKTHTEAWTIQRKAALGVRHAASPALRRDYAAAHVQAVMLTVGAQTDLGDGPDATRALSRATSAANELGDRSAVGHGYLLRAAIYQQTGDPARAAATAARGVHEAGRTPVAITLAATEAAYRAAAGDRDRAREALALAEALAADSDPAAAAAPGWTDGGHYSPAYIETLAAHALTRLGDTTRAREHADAARGQADAYGATGLAVYARAQAASATIDGDLDQARELLADAIVTARTAERPTAWLAGSAAAMARRAEARGQSWHDLVGAAQV